MSLSMYEASVPVFIRSFGNLSRILAKGLAHAEANKINPATLIDARLFENMYSLPGQIQRASDTAKGCASRLSGVEAPKFEDNEKTFSELQDRITKTVDFLETVKPDQINGSEQRTVTLNLAKKPVNFEGQNYLLNFALPNFFFHVTTAYDILRHKGVSIAKPDYLGGF